MKKKCDICGTTKGLRCEILTKGEDVDRVYHFCPEHWVDIYRRTLDDFVEDNEYKVNTYIKMVADKLIVDEQNRLKISEYVDDEGNIEVNVLEPMEIRRLRPYEDDRSDGFCE